MASWRDYINGLGENFQHASGNTPWDVFQNWGALDPIVRMENIESAIDGVMENAIILVEDEEHPGFYFFAPGTGGLEPVSDGFPALAADLIGLGSNMPRASANQTNLNKTAGQVDLSYLTAHKDGSSVGVLMNVGTTAASGLTYNRIALYSVAENGDLTFMVATADLGATLAASSLLTPNWTAPQTIVEGQRYAVGTLQVGTTPCSFRGATLSGTGMLTSTPFLGRSITAGQATLGASFVAANLSFLSTGVPYAALI